MVIISIFKYLVVEFWSNRAITLYSAYHIASQFACLQHDKFAMKNREIIKPKTFVSEDHYSHIIAI